MNNKLEGSWSSSGDIIMAWIHMVAIKMERSKWVIFKSEVLIDSLDSLDGSEKVKLTSIHVQVSG